MEIVFFWFMLAFVVGVAASRKGRSGFGWFLLAAVISPLIAGLLVLLASDRREPGPPKDELGNAITPETHVKCPDCRELVRRDARKCKHCGTALVPQ